MNIQGKINFLTVVTYLTYFIMGINVVWAYYSFDKAVIQARYATETMEVVSKLTNQLRLSVFNNEDERPLVNWYNKQNKLMLHLSQKPALTPLMKRYILGLERRYYSITALEAALFEHNNTFDEKEGLAPIKSHLKNKLFLQLEAVREEAKRLSVISQKEIEQVLYTHGISFIAIFLLLVLPITLSTSHLANDIKQSLIRLTKGTMIVSGGKFDQHIDGLRNDEFGVFAHHFNLMVDHIDETTISRDSLQELVDERTKELQELSEMDALTRIHNRRFYNHRITSDIGTAKRTNQYLSLMMIDIDNFKGYNDTYGHDMGDAALINVAKVIDETLPRATDSVSRFGGEEFIVLLPSTDAEGAFVLAERIRSYIKTLAIPHSISVLGVLSVSIGVSSMASKELNEVDLLKHADLALYEAKDNGRNQSVVFTD